MPSPILYAVPDDAKTPFPVDMARVSAMLRELEGQSFPRNFSQLEGSAVIRGLPYQFALFGGGGYLSVRSEWKPTGSLDRPSLFAAANAWNQTTGVPTVYLDARGEDVVIVADKISHCRHGLSNEQLGLELSSALAGCAEALEHVRNAVSHQEDVP